MLFGTVVIQISIFIENQGPFPPVDYVALLSLSSLTYLRGLICEFDMF